MNLPVMNEDRTVSDRLIRAVRHERASDWGKIWIEERYKPGEPYAVNVDKSTQAETSIITTWHWRLVFNGNPADYQIALIEWIRRMRQHPEATAYAAQFR